MFRIGLEQVCAQRGYFGMIRCVSRSFRVIDETTLADFLLPAQLAGWRVSEQAKKAASSIFTA
jgi:hypothetical protein